MAKCAIEFNNMKALLGAKKLGTYTALSGWQYDGKPISSVELDRGKMMRFYSSSGVCLAAFQDRCYIDD